MDKLRLEVGKKKTNGPAVPFRLPLRKKKKGKSTNEFWGEGRKKAYAIRITPGEEGNG